MFVLVDWLLPLYEKLWMKMLQVDQRVDPGCVNIEVCNAYILE